MRENLGVFDFTLDPSDVSALDALTTPDSIKVRFLTPISHPPPPHHFHVGAAVAHFETRQSHPHGISPRQQSAHHHSLVSVFVHRSSRACTTSASSATHPWAPTSFPPPTLWTSSVQGAHTTHLIISSLCGILLIICGPCRRFCIRIEIIIKTCAVDRTVNSQLNKL
jgi:hypothetical protein